MNIWEERQTSLDGDQRERDAFSRDRSRVIHSAFFRRLQGKTQVLGLGESDFYRTRLTHSIEVAQIASGIVDHLQSLSATYDDELPLPPRNLIETIALAHDIGHPPFGHGGEVALNYVMRSHGGFEGNAQTLRIGAKLGEYSDGSGLNLTRRAMLGLIKYPARYSEVVVSGIYDEAKAPENLDSFKPPKCVFDCDNDCLEFIFNPFKSEIEKFKELEAKEGKHKKTKHKSFDTSIMEIADDIAYGVHDLEDAVALRLVTERTWNQEVRDQIKALEEETALKINIDSITSDLFSGANKVRKKSIGFLVGYFIRASTVKKKDFFDESLLDFKAEMGQAPTAELDILKNFVIKNVIKTAEVQTLEYKGQQMIVKLFETLANNPSRLLPKKYYDEYKEKGSDPRVICDYIAGTTDDYATRLYHKIFTPSTGSIFDRL